MTDLFMYVVSLSIKGCVVIPLIMLVRFLIRKQPKIYSYALWFVVFTGLVFNINITFDAGSIYSPVSDLHHRADKRYAELMDDYVDDVGVYFANKMEYYQALEQGIQPVYDFSDGSRYVITAKDTIAPPPTFENTTMPKLANIWGMGVVIALFVVLKNLVSFHAKLQFAKKAEGNIYFADDITSPFVYGIIKPKIYIPSSMADMPLDSVIRHEQIHIRRCDHIIKPLALAVAILHWFNPSVWLGFRLMCRDMEMSCDEAVVKNSTNKKEYSLRLLSCAVEKHTGPARAVLFGETDAESRIKNVLAYKKPAKMVSLLLAAVVAICATACVVEEKVTEKIPDKIPPTFYEQLAKLNSTEDVEYKERNLAENITRNSFKRDGYIPPENVPEYYKQALPYNISKGYYSDEQFSFSYVNGMDRENMYVCIFDGTTTQSKKIPVAENETLVSYAGGYEPLNDKTAFLSYITKDTDSNVWLNIQKIDTTETEWDYEITRHQLNRDNYFLIRGLRFLNEDVGFMGQTDSIYHIEPQANITVDGGKTWCKLDFSLLAVPEYFSKYRSCCMTMIGQRIEIRYFVGVTQKAIKDNVVGSYDEKYCIVSEDGGLTWTGYARKSSGEGGYIKLTDTIPVQIMQ